MSSLAPAEVVLPLSRWEAGRVRYVPPAVELCICSSVWIPAPKHAVLIALLRGARGCGRNRLQLLMGGRDLYWLPFSQLLARPFLLQSSLSPLQDSFYPWAQNTTLFFRSTVFLYANSGELFTF